MHRVAPFAAEHHGVFDLRAARRSGIDHDDIKFALQQGEIVRLHRGVYRFAAAPDTWRGRQLAACWAAGPRGFASHRAAAQVHAIPGGDELEVVITCPRWRRAHHDGIVVHETSLWCSRDVVVVDAIPVANPALTLLELAATLPRSALEVAFENVLRRSLASVAELDELLCRYARRGRPGVRRLRALVVSRSERVRPTDSVRETLLLQVLRRHGLPEPVRQHPIRVSDVEVATVDLAYPGARIAIEYDSDEFHKGRVATAKDSARRHHLIAAGWLPVTAVKSDLRSGGTVLARALRSALEDRSRRAVLPSPEPAPLVGT